MQTPRERRADTTMACEAMGAELAIKEATGKGREKRGLM
jgi:hypothetical protein